MDSEDKRERFINFVPRITWIKHQDIIYCELIGQGYDYEFNYLRFDITYNKKERIWSYGRYAVPHPPITFQTKSLTEFRYLNFYFLGSKYSGWWKILNYCLNKMERDLVNESGETFDLGLRNNSEVTIKKYKKAYHWFIDGIDREEDIEYVRSTRWNERTRIAYVKFKNSPEIYNYHSYRVELKEVEVPDIE